MTQDEIIEMAKQAGFIFLDGLGDEGECRKYGEAWPEQIEAFAKLVEERTAAKERADEREACAKIVENEACQYASPVWALGIVNAIKDRGEAK